MVYVIYDTQNILSRFVYVASMTATFKDSRSMIHGNTIIKSPLSHVANEHESHSFTRVHDSRV